MPDLATRTLQCSSFESKETEFDGVALVSKRQIPLVFKTLTMQQ